MDDTGGTLYQGSNVFRSENEFNYMQGTNIITGEPSWTDYTFSFDVTPTDNDGLEPFSGTKIRIITTDSSCHKILPAMAL